MTYNSGTNSIIADVDFLAGTDVTSYPLADKTRNANIALDRVTSLIQRADNKWEWDDSNNTDLPIATTDIVASQQDYSIAVTHLKIFKVRIKDSNGDWISLDPINRRELTDSQLTATAGTSSRYDKLGNSLFLYPKPSYASTAGLEVQFQRTASYFITTDTTKEPGFASQFHRLISFYMALDYCDVNGLDKRSAKIQAKINILEAELLEFYSARDWDTKNSFSLSKEDYGESALSGMGSSNPDGFF